jgi:hypothetical protein
VTRTDRAKKKKNVRDGPSVAGADPAPTQGQKRGSYVLTEFAAMMQEEKARSACDKPTDAQGAAQ